MSNENEEINVEPEGVDPSQAEEREMYIGSIRSYTRRETMKDLYRGIVQYIKEGCMIVVLDIEYARGYPF